MPPRSHRTIDRVTQILEIVSGRPDGCTLTELARELDAPKSSIQGFVNGLVHTGYLDEHQRRYFLGPAPYMLTLRANRLPARSVGHADLVELGEQSGFNTLLAVRVGQHVVYIDEVGEGGEIRQTARSRGRRPLIETVSGRVLLAHADEETRHALLANYTDETLIRRFLTEMPRILRTGVAINEQSHLHDLSAIGCGVRDRYGTVVAAVTLTGPPEELLPRLDELADLLRRTTDKWAHSAF